MSVDMYPSSMSFVRFALGVLITIGVLVVALPAMVLLDLVAGGTGLGLCPTGLGTCSTSIYTISELVIVLGLILAVIGGGIALCARILRTHGDGRSVGLG